ncbi:MAG TPA: hypothetical protein VF215_17410 [Thermoanaerobaculia bacterium]
MKRALALLLLSAACASNDGFVSDDVKECGPGSLVTIEAGWDTQSMGAGDRGDNRLTMLVRVSNNSSEDIRVKFVRVDPMMFDRDTAYEIEGGALDVDKLIAEGDDATFEIPMMSRRRMQNRAPGVRASEVDVVATVVLESKESYRCRFRVPLGF